MSDQANIEKFQKQYHGVREQVAKAIVGHDEIVDGVLTCLFAGGHALLEGVPGLGKTLLIRSLSEALHLQFNRIQFTPDLMPADIVGTNLVVMSWEKLVLCLAMLYLVARPNVMSSLEDMGVADEVYLWGLSQRTPTPKRRRLSGIAEADIA